MLRRALPLLAVLCAVRAPLAAQSAALELVPLSGDTIRVGAAEWAGLPRDTVHVAPAEGAGHAPAPGLYTGVPMRALLTRMGVPEGAAVRGEALRLVVVAEASDGYRVLFALPELDPVYTDDAVLVADARDGGALAEGEGPLRLLVPGDRRPARWARGVVRLTVVRVP